MNIKTVTTTDGVNEVDFGSNASRFYWFQNIGTTTVHVSGNADIVAGADGVAELAAGDSVCIETLGGKVYVLGAGKVQIHNTGDKFCPFKNAPAAGGGGGNSYTKSESDAKYAQKTDIPSSLPANGGNADTVDGYHVDDRHYADGSIPPNYFTEFLRINDDTKSIERWSTDNLKVAFARNATNAVDADTIDGKHAEDFIYPRAMLSDIDLDTILYPCSAVIYGDCTNAPTPTSWGTLLCYSGGTGSHVQLWVTAADSSMFKRHYNGERWSDWKEISTTPIKSTTFSTTSDETGNFSLLSANDNKVPIYIKLDNKPFYAVPFLYYNQLWMGGTISEITRQPVTDTTVSGTVYYIEV